MKPWLLVALWGVVPVHSALAASQKQVCELTANLRARTKARGRGKPVLVARGTQVSVGSAVRKWTAARVKGRTLYFRSRGLEKFCRRPVPVPASRPGAPDEASRRLAESTPVIAAPPKDHPPTDVFGVTDKIKVVVLDLRGTGIDTETRNALTQVLSETLDDLGPFSTLSSRDVASMLEMERQKALLGCDDDSCFAEVGVALGANLLVSGSVVRIGKTAQIQLQLTNVLESQVIGRASREFRGDPAQLFDAMRAASQILVRDILAEKSGMLRVNVREEGASIRVDDKLVGVSPIESMTLAGGLHTVEVEKTGFVTYREDVKISQGTETLLELTLVPSAEFIAQYKADAVFSRTMAWMSIGVGAIGLGVSATAYAVGVSETDSLNADIAAFNAQSLRTTPEAEKLADREQQIARWDTTMLVAGGVGLVALATGVLLLVTGDSPSRYDIDTDIASRGGGPVFVDLGPRGGLIGLRF